MGKKYKSDGADEQTDDQSSAADPPADVTATGSILVSSQVLHQREWFGRIYGMKPTLLKIADLQPGELEKLQSDTFLTIEPV